MVYPTDITQQIQQFAEQAAEARRAALSHVLKALISHLKNDLPAGFSELFTKLGIRPESEADAVWNILLARSEKKHAVDVMRNGLRFVCEQLVLPNLDRPNFILSIIPELLVWVRSIQQQLNLTETPREVNEVHSQWYCEVPLTEEHQSVLRKAIESERAARRYVNDLVEMTFTYHRDDGTACNPILGVVRQVLSKRGIDRSKTDEILSDSIQRLYSRIDAFPVGHSSFLNWWRSLVDRCLIDFLESQSQVEQLRDDYTDENVSRPIWESSQHDVSFSDRDWAVICAWADRDFAIPVVVLTGFGLVGKAHSDTEHWTAFCHWLEQYGVEDCDGFAEGIDDYEWSTKGQLQRLADFSGNSYNNVRNQFSRQFGGIQQQTRQTSFGKKHHIVELDFFWQAGWVSTRHLSEQTYRQLEGLEVAPRVAALCCAPGWQLFRGRVEWQIQSENYPFAKCPPLLELIKSDFILEPHHVDYLPGHITNQTEVQSYFREQVLAHGTAGNFGAACELVRDARTIGLVLEKQIRMIQQSAELG